MKYRSTRSDIYADSLSAVLDGIASDGGLYVPSMDYLSGFNWKDVMGLPYKKMATAVLSYLLPDFEDMDSLVESAYTGRFETDEVTPLVKVGRGYVLELFRGPTSAFKDVALSMLPRLITKARVQKHIKEKTFIITATSGDTGKAALEGFKDVEGTGIVVFYPHNGVSEVQKAQMVCQDGNNVNVCAVKGNFDDCQTAVKKAFATLKNDLPGFRLSSANSINIGRLAPQVVYYFKAYSDLVDIGSIKQGDLVDFIVPTGNFGDIIAGFYAKLMGLPVGNLVCASNENKVLDDFIKTGIYDVNRPFYKTTSPSMDILVSSNLERLLFFACGCDCNKVSSWMNDLAKNGRFEVDEETIGYIRKHFSSCSCSEYENCMTIGDVWKKYGYLCDPHTAVGLFVSEKIPSERTFVCLSTASPYKFPDAVLTAIEGKQGENCDEFAQMRKLNLISGVPIPKALGELEGKKIRFENVVEANNIASYVKESLWK